MVSGTRIASISGLRGIVGDGLDPVVVGEFSAAYAAECGPGPIVVGHDGRRSASMMKSAVLAGLTGSGRDVLDLGAAATPTVGVAIAASEAAGGIQISASHNPAEYNGLKFFQSRGMVLGPDQGKKLLVRFQDQSFEWAAWDRLGTSQPAEFDTVHLARIAPIVDFSRIIEARFRVVLDSNHGAGGVVGKKLLASWAGELIHLGAEPDGFYDHLPEPTEANLETISMLIPAQAAHVGFAQDPDADRLAIIDEKGRYIGEELTLALVALHRLRQERGPVVANLSTSRAVDIIAKDFGCPVHRTPVGEIHVVEKMIAEGAILGGEGNGGVIDPRVGYVRDSFAAMALILDLMAETDEPLSILVDRLPKLVMVKQKYPLAGDGPSIEERLETIAKSHPEAKVDNSDGLRLDWADGWAHVRASNTEPIVRVIAEAEVHARAASLAESLGRQVRGERV